MATMKFVPTTKEGLPESDVSSRFLNPGDFSFGDASCQIHTVLGSCVAITLWHPVLHIGGMCHFVLPGRRTHENVTRTDSEPNGRYADAVIALFQREAAQYGTNLKEYQAKIFGGSIMLRNVTIKKDEMVGLRNIEAALKQLFDNEIPLLFAHVGETGHRRIVFDIKSGDVWVKHEPLKKIIF